MCPFYGLIFIAQVIFKKKLPVIFLEGQLLLIDEFKNFLLKNLNMETTKLFEGISQNEHPYYNIAFYNLHPCQTAQLMGNIQPKNYILA